MDLLDSLNILVKRWLLTLPLLLLTIVALAAAAVVLPWSYQASASMVFLGSPFQAKTAGGNPWLVFDGSLTVTAEVVGREMMDDRTVQELKAKGLTSSYTVGIAPNSTGPVLSVDVTGPDQANTAATMNAIITMIPQKLAQIQADGGVSPTARITLDVISVSRSPRIQSTKKIRNLALVLVGGLALTVIVPLSVESMAVRRRTRAAGGPPQTTGSAQPEGPRPMAVETRIGNPPSEVPRTSKTDTGVADPYSRSNADT